MKLIFALIMLLVLQRCGGKEAGQEQDQFTLKVDETIEAGGLKLQLLSIRDSRCPKDVRCVWAGAAITTLSVQAPSTQDTLQFCLGSCGRETPSGGGKNTDTLTVNGRRYALSLLEVNPYPGTGGEVAEKNARYSFSELP